MNSSAEFTPDHFLAMVERERRWCELLISAMLTRAELRSLGVRLLTDNTVAAALTMRGRALRN
jgi:hypothetical protein